MNTYGSKRFRNIALFLGIGLCALLSGCSSRPSAGDGGRAIEDQIREESEGRIKLTKFEKTNGQDAELMGVKIYAMDFAAEIEFTEDCKWVTGMFGIGLSFRTTKPPANGGNTLLQFNEDMMNPGSVVRKGSKAQVAGAVRFVKKERGWALAGVDLARAAPIGGPVSSSPASVKGVEPSSGNKGKAPRKLDRTCYDNMKKIAYALTLYNIEHNAFPFNVSTNAGGTKELCLRSADGFDQNAALHLLVITGALETPKVLVCPADSAKRPARTFASLTPANVTYQIRSGPEIVVFNTNAVMVRCPIHGYVIHPDGFVDPR